MLQYPLLLIACCLLYQLTSCQPKDKANYYSNGQVKSVDSLDRTGRLRLMTNFRPDGTLERKYPVQNGHIQGLVKRYDARGKLASTEVWANGHPDGVVTGYYPTGRVWFTKTLRDSTVVDTSRVYYPNGVEWQFVVRTAQGRRVDFSAWRPNGQVDTTYTRPFFLTDRDTVPNGQNYAFEVVLGNRRSDAVNVKIVRPLTRIDSTKGVYSRSRYIIRRPALGRHVVTVEVVNIFQVHTGSDTLWYNHFKPISKSFWVVPAPSE